MSQTVSKKISESKGARWAALIIVSFTMMWGYFLTDALSPLMTMLEEQMGWTSLEFGQFNWAYCWFNVFLFMLIFGGIILDKMGVRFTGIVTCFLMLAGALIKYYAVNYMHSGIRSMPWLRHIRCRYRELRNHSFEGHHQVVCR